MLRRLPPLRIKIIFRRVSTPSQDGDAAVCLLRAVGSTAVGARFGPAVRRQRPILHGLSGALRRLRGASLPVRAEAYMPGPSSTKQVAHCDPAPSFAGRELRPGGDSPAELSRVSRASAIPLAGRASNLARHRPTHPRRSACGQTRARSFGVHWPCAGTGTHTPFSVDDARSAVNCLVEFRCPA